MSYPAAFGKYLLLDRINVGGMAEVFVAKAFGVEGFERYLAVKRILPNMAEDDEFINMFVDEARIAVQLSHANIVQILELGKFEGQYYIAMEYVSGRDLRQILDQFRREERLLPIPAAVYIASRICDGLDYAHRKTDPTGRPLNVIHRDVSPQNILVGFGGEVKITDFGIAKAEDRASKTQAGVLKGKFGYMSPEQVKGMGIDRRSDVFALGILMYEILTGQRLFIGESDFATLEHVRAAEVTPPREHNPEIPDELEAVMLKALAGDREQRYQWASDLQEALGAFLIQDGTLFNAKGLARVMEAEYADTIVEEREKMKRFMDAQAPQEALQSSQAMRAAPMQREGSGERSEKTMIYESEFSAAPDGTVTHGGSPSPDSMSSETSISVSLESPATTGPPPAAPPVSIAPNSSVAMRPPVEEPKTALLAVGTLVAVLLGVLLWLVLAPSSELGSLIVTTSPAKNVEILVDDEVVGTESPCIVSDVPLGEHTLWVRAPGYVDKRLRFELVGTHPTPVMIDLERDASRSQLALEVVTEPAGATVKIAGVTQGTTPLTLKKFDPNRPVILELSKEGFLKEVKTAVFEPNETRKRLSVTLQPVPQVAKPTVRLAITTEPAGVGVTLNNIPRGQTPLEVSGLMGNSVATLKLEKDGYVTRELEVELSGDEMQQVQMSLEAKRVKRRKKQPRKRSRGGGGGCKGSGAKLNVMPIGVADCTVTVGSTKLGVAPLFQKDAPVGRCTIKVTCKNGKTYETIKDLPKGSVEKVIIKSGDWQGE